MTDQLWFPLFPIASKGFQRTAHKGEMMTNSKSENQPNALFMTADELREYADTIDTARASEAFDGMKNAEEARKLLMDRMSKPIEVTDQMRANILARVKAAAKDGKEEIMVLQFPVELCTDDGRAINNNEPEWPDTLTGVPRQAYEAWRDRLKPAGYRLTASIVEWPHGMPGDVGMFLGWSKPKHL